MRIAVTGASGYVGRALLQLLPGPAVVIGRTPVEGHAFRSAFFSDGFDASVLEGVDAIVHLAADTSGSSDGIAAAAEISFAGALAAAAQHAGIPAVIVSSQVASANAPSIYGRTKAAIEDAVLPMGARVVRPGLVYGGQAAGLFGLLVMLVAKVPIVPALWPAPFIQPVHVADLAAALLAATRAPGGRVYSVAGPPLRFDTFLRGIAAFRLGVYRAALPVPIVLLRGVLALARPVLGSRLSPERLDSLISVPIVDARADLLTLGVTLRCFEGGVTRSGQLRRPRLEEGWRLMRAVAGRGVSVHAARAYARALEVHRISGAPWSRLAPWRAQLAGGRSGEPVGSLPWRIGVASRIAECVPALAGRFIRAHPGRLAAFADLLAAALIECRVRLLRLVLGPER